MRKPGEGADGLPDPWQKHDSPALAAQPSAVAPARPALQRTASVPTGPDVADLQALAGAGVGAPVPHRTTKTPTHRPQVARSPTQRSLYLSRTWRTYPPSPLPLPLPRTRSPAIRTHSASRQRPRQRLSTTLTLTLRNTAGTISARLTLTDIRVQFNRRVVYAQVAE